MLPTEPNQCSDRTIMPCKGNHRKGTKAFIICETKHCALNRKTYYMSISEKATHYASSWLQHIMHIMALKRLQQMIMSVTYIGYKLAL